MALTTAKINLAKWNIGMTAITLVIFWVIFTLIPALDKSAFAVAFISAFAGVFAIIGATNLTFMPGFIVAMTGAVAVTFAITFGGAIAFIGAFIGAGTSALVFMVAFAECDNLNISFKFAFSALSLQTIVIFGGMVPALFL